MKRTLIALTLFVSAQVAGMPIDTPAQALLAKVGHDHFAAASDGLYTGVSDSSLKTQLNAKIDAAAVAFANAASTKASAPQILAILKEHLGGIDREVLDTEDAEHVAGLFEQMLDGFGIQGSDGILNNWLYGFDPA
jgi:hypothetical protein